MRCEEVICGIRAGEDEEGLAGSLVGGLRRNADAMLYFGCIYIHFNLVHIKAQKTAWTHFTAGEAWISRAVWYGADR